MIYYYPNKPILIHPTSTVVEDKSNDDDWWAEVKKNGTRLCLWKSKEDSGKFKSYDDFIFWNRHKSVLKYEPSKEILEELNSLNIPEGTHIDAELLHHKTKNIKNFIYVYDIYRYKGKQVYESLEVRRNMLEEMFSGTYQHIELAKRYFTDFRGVFNEVIKTPENEGLVMKNKKSSIVWCLKDCLEVPWQLKIRKASGSYQF